MASLASLGSLGSGAGNTLLFEGNISLVRRVSITRSNHSDARRRWHRVSFCRCSFTTTNLFAEQGNVVSLDTDTITNKGSRNGSDDAEKVVLKAAPKPVLRPPAPSSTAWGGGGASGGDSLEGRNSVIESLGEVLEKAEKLETSTTNVSVDKSVPLNTNGPSRSVYRPGQSNPRGNLRPQTGRNRVQPSKNVWRKGDSVSTVKKVVDLSPTVETAIEKEEEAKVVAEVKVEKEEESKVEEEVKVEAPAPLPQPVAALKPVALPLRPAPRLQARPAVAPPPLPPLKKPVILKDVGAIAKSPAAESDSNGGARVRKTILKDVGASPRSLVAEETDPAANIKERKPILKDVGASPKGTEETERKPILVDKFATKKAPVDPSVAQAVEVSRRTGKGVAMASGKFKDAPSKRNVRGKSLKRRMFNDESSEGSSSRKGRKWSKASRRAARLQAIRDAAPVKVEILEVGEKGMLMEELAFNLAVNVGELYGTLLAKGIRPEGVQTLDRDIVKMICEEYEVEVIDADPFRVEEMAKKKEILDEEDLDNLEDRPPVLTIMGHVDHGKTTLLDHIRKSRVAASEAGGITQGIGAYKVLVPVDGESQQCVFLDTPGHEAFGAMRARGARVTDIAIIVVAADDGIRPQTKEAIAHAKSAGVPIVIAINKIDKDGANPDKVMEELSSIGLMPEAWGGDVPMVPISALNGDNVDELLETAMLVAELQELMANPHRNAKGTVIEAGLHKSKGPVATFIVQNGTLKRGDTVVCGEAYGKMRAIFDDAGVQIAEAGPSMPVQVIGLNNVPIAGDEFEVVDSLDEAREKAEARAESLRNERILAKAGDGKVTLSSLASAVSNNKTSGLDLHQLNIIMKVDVQGSIEAVKQALQVLPQDNVTLKFLLEATGDVTNSDIDLAVAGKAVVFGFNTKVPGPVQKYADSKNVEIRSYKVIYDLIDDVRKAMEGLLDPVEEQITIGSAEVRAIFSSGSGRVAGCMVSDGKVTKDCGVRVLRRGKEIHVGKLDSLRRVKEAVKEVNMGLECGIAIEDYTDWEEGDIIEAFITVEKKRTLEEASATMTAALEGGGVRL